MPDPTNHNGGYGEDDDEDEEVDDTGYRTVKDAVLFAIDVSKTMLKDPPPSDSKKADHDKPAVAALKCAYTLMQQRIISNPNDMMGVLLFGTEKSRFQDEDEHSRGLSYPHCYLLTDLEVPAAADVKRLKSLVEDEDEAADLLKPSDEEVSMANVLFCANQIFTTKAPNFSSRRLFLVTDNDDPHSADKSLRSAAAVRAKDLYDLGVTIELFPISHSDHAFDRSTFYDDIIYSSTPADPDAPVPVTTAAKASSGENGISLLQSLLSNIASKAAPRRALFSNLAFEIAPGVKISVKGFILLKRQEPVRSSFIYIGGEQPQIAKGVSTLTAEDTARTVEKADVRKAYKFGGETITFKEEEMKAMRNFGDPVLRIIGFKPLSALPTWANHKPSTFIYPSEEDFVGSSRVFSALQQKLLKDQKMGLAWFIPRRNAIPTLAAIIPGAEQLSKEGVQTMPAGLWIRPLPCADDVRFPPDVNVVRATDDLIDMIRVVVQQLQLPGGVYDPQKHSNPALQWFYRILQALALEEELPEKPDDKTIPRYRQIDKRAGQYVIEWGQELEKQHIEYQRHNAGTTTATGAAKRGTTTNSASRGDGSKKPKTANGGVPATTNGALSDADMKSKYENDTVSKLTVAVLKEWLSSKGLKPTSKKADLVDQVTSYFETKMEE
ncbi:Ku DNA-binding complex, Ku70 subunit [Myriangium duriaei CBS 260.36]|uniref:ATP-dependent DNA helicase II subunit 1 n=1 Tax=Myriangium duriaei CBS 260.36 TaxID=1168546 RepID=A0A9P4MKD3_9PEZI|nr:Ku DNA-binding complex, Ku70 subunit [Myriangium duriaei CBS 260.36]